MLLKPALLKKATLKGKNLAAKKWTGLTKDTRSKVGTNEVKSKV